MTNWYPKAISTACVSLGLIACGAKSPEEHLTEARKAFAAQDLAAANVHLRELLQKDPRSAEARLLLGRTLLKLGDLGGAETQFNKATELGVPEKVLALPQARLWLAQAKHKQLLEAHRDTRLDVAVDDVELRLVVARAHAALDDVGQAEQALSQALAVQADHEGALLLRARLKLLSGNRDEAVSLLQPLTQRPKPSDESWLLMALAQSDGDSPSAEVMTSLRKALSLNPKNSSAHTGLVQLLLREGKLEEAKQQLDAFDKAVPGDLSALGLSIQLALANKNITKARDDAQELLKRAGDSATALLLAGQVAFQAGDWLGCTTHLGKALSLNPDLMQARALLARSYLKQGETEKALNTLKPRLSGDLASPDLLTLAGEIHLLRGETAKAEAAFAAATSKAPEHVQSRLSLALLRIASGQQERGFAELQSLAEGDGGQNAALALVSSRLQNRQFDQALRDIDKLQAKNPQSGLPYQLRGQVELNRRQLVAARNAYEEALKRDADDFLSVSALAALDIAEQAGNSKAIARFENFLKRQPRNIKARMAVLRLHAGAGVRGAEFTKLLQATINQIPDAAEPRLTLVRHLLDMQEAKAALAAAQEAAAALPNQVEVLDALGRAQLVNGELLQANSTYARWTSLQPQSVTAQLRVAEVQVARKDIDGAIETLKRALQQQPQHLDAQRTLVGLLLSRSNFEAALAQARDIQGRRSQRAVGLIIEGDIEAYRRAWPAARKAYAAALELEPRSSQLASKLYLALLGSDDRGGATKLVEKWLKEHPRDQDFLVHLGNVASADKQLAQAEGFYAKAMAINPDNPIVANNLAWLRVKLKRGDALSLAQQLNAKHPGNPVYLNTLALAFAEAGQLERALQVQREALGHGKLAPLRLQLAELLVRAGKIEDAKRELQALTQLAASFPEKAQAQQLLSKLK